MAELNASIYASPLAPSVADYQKQNDALESNKLALLLQRGQVEQAQQGMNDDRALRMLYADPGFNINDPASQRRLMQVSPKGALGLLKAEAERRKAEADYGKTTTETKGLVQGQDIKAHEFKVTKANQAITDIAALSNRDEAIASLDRHKAAGDIDDTKYSAVRATIPDDPAQFPEWRKNMMMRIMDAKTQLEMTAPKVEYEKAGGSLVPVQKNAYAGQVGPMAGVAPVVVTRTPDSLASEAAADRRAGELNARTRETLNETVRHNQAVESGKTGYKPMPGTAVKMQNEDLLALGTYAGLDSDLAALESQLLGGKLKLGPVSNLVGQARNAVGVSSEESRNLATFKAKLENMRNAVLLLNKGVQTEGDAQRAMNEMISNINDPGVVSQRLAEIRALNRRAAELRKNNVDVLRSNYGQPEMDYSKFSNQPASVNLTPGSKPPPLTAPVPIKSDADYASLPSGTRFKAPDGSIRVKP